MSKRNKKGKKKDDFDVVASQMTQPNLESFVYGFIQSRGFDLCPRIKVTDDGYEIALYYDRGDKGWWRVFKLELEGHEKPAQFAIGVALVNHLYSAGVQPRTPAPVGELAAKAIRNEILGQLQDGVNPETAIQLLNNVASHITRHLRPAMMKIDFGDNEPEEIAKLVEEGVEVDEDEDVEAEGNGVVTEGESLDVEPEPETE